MASYDYRCGKERVEAILNNELNVIEKEKVPKDDQFTFDNSYKCWITAVFVDIRDSSKLFSNGDEVKVSKIIRSFTSEIIEILRKDENLREIGIRGDCVYAIYSTAARSDIYEVMQKVYYVNTYLKMLNTLLEKKNYPTIDAGIGVSSAKELIVKAGRKDVGINSKVWIGEAVTKASNLSSLGNKNNIRPIVLSNCTHHNIIDETVKLNGDKSRKWFKINVDNDYGTYYDADIIQKEFNDWITTGMKD